MAEDGGGQAVTACGLQPAIPMEKNPYYSCKLTPPSAAGWTPMTPPLVPPAGGSANSPAGSFTDSFTTGPPRSPQPAAAESYTAPTRCRQKTPRPPPMQRLSERQPSMAGAPQAEEMRRVAASRSQAAEADLLRRAAEWERRSAESEHAWGARQEEPRPQPLRRVVISPDIDVTDLV